MEMGPQLKVSSHRLVKPVVKHRPPGFQGEWFIHYTKAAPIFPDVNLGILWLLPESSQKIDHLLASHTVCFRNIEE